MYLKVIACEIFFREICYCAARSKNVIDVEFLTQGYHDVPETGRDEIQKRIDAVPANKYDAIVLGYALCSKITAGLHSKHTRLVIPRAHDCITLFLGSAKRYKELFAEYPGTYYYTSGWLEYPIRRGVLVEVDGLSLPASASEEFKLAKAKLVEKYGADNAEYLLSEFARWSNIYTRGVLINFEFTRHLGLDKKVKDLCNQRGWKYAEIDGDLGLLQRLVDGDWNNDEFVVIDPGEIVVPAFDDKIFDKSKVKSASNC